MIRLAIFDVDGTLVDSGATIHRALAASLDAHGHPCPPRATTQKVIGLSLERAIASLAPDADHEAVVGSYKQAFADLRSAGDADERLFDGVAAMLEAMEEDGWLLAIATGKSRRGVDHLVDLHGWQGRFVSIQTADTNASKPDPAMALAAMAATGADRARTVFVGDTGWDMGCARAARIHPIGVAWGYHDADDLRGAGAHYIAGAPAEVAPLARACVDG
ncbi:HAD-IA family hydrolase [Sphingomonas sp. ASV193]|uniref:HAD-IA family hydrolase n=1 Tax=Sphingomonas sp. ASV193 TaxID=3144405 RepID=UPI0032E865EB